MVTVIFFLLMIVVLAFLAFAGEKGWIKLPDNPDVLKLIAVIGVPVLFVILFFVVLFPIKIYSLIAEYGVWYLLSNIAIVLAIAFAAFTLGFVYFRWRRRRGSSAVQELNIYE